nr:hypothetical protein [Tanacetum cinerariifolium]
MLIEARRPLLDPAIHEEFTSLKIIQTIALATKVMPPPSLTFITTILDLHDHHASDTVVVESMPPPPPLPPPFATTTIHQLMWFLNT